MRSAFLVALSALSIAGCQQQEAATEAPPAEPAQAPAQQAAPADDQQEIPGRLEGEQQTAARGDCDPRRQGSVSLTANGAVNDQFSITLTCGGQQVAHCSAKVAVANTPVTCNDGPHPEIAGAADCVVRPANGNSPAATNIPNGCTF